MIVSGSAKLRFLLSEITKSPCLWETLAGKFFTISYLCKMFSSNVADASRRDSPEKWLMTDVSPNDVMHARSMPRSSVFSISNKFPTVCVIGFMVNEQCSFLDGRGTVILGSPRWYITVTPTTPASVRIYALCLWTIWTFEQHREGY